LAELWRNSLSREDNNLLARRVDGSDENSAGLPPVEMMPTLPYSAPALPSLSILQSKGEHPAAPSGMNPLNKMCWDMKGPESTLPGPPLPESSLQSPPALNSDEEDFKAPPPRAIPKRPLSGPPLPQPTLQSPAPPPPPKTVEVPHLDFSDL